MASKFGIASGIPERRVRPIWDAIDSRQFKNALKLSATLLSKYPNSPYALALKGLILERMGKLDEAFSVCITAKEMLFNSASILIDDLTLSTLQIVFQRLDHLDVATNCYEYACGKFPNNVELMMGLFNCYVREYSFVKQQQIAMKMYKIVGEERFLLWAVCSFQLQVFCGSGEDKLLLLAEGLLKKHIATHNLHEPEALSVYISLLEYQSKYGEALEILSGKLGSLIVIEVDKLRIQGRLLARAGDYVLAADIFQRVLELCPDDWECFQNYLSCLIGDDSNWIKGAQDNSIYLPNSADCKNLHLTDEMFDSRISRASDFVSKLAENASNDSIRCPYLASLEIERRKLIYGRGDMDQLIEVMMQYFCRFGHLPCFASDVETFLEVLTGDKKNELLDKLVESCGAPVAVPKLLGQSITVFKVRELIGDMCTLSATEGFAVQMTDLYCKNLPLSKDLDIQESVHGEDLLSMACNILVQLFWRTKHIGYLLEAIMILEFGLTIRRHVSQYKILLLHLYSHWCALPLAYDWYKSLDVKNILLETVSHHILPQMLTYPLWNDLSDLLNDYLKFMDAHFRESADLTFLAYRHRNYSKVIEFVQFKERLQRSSQYLLAKIEAPILHLKQNADSIEKEESVLEILKCGTHFLELSSEIGSKSLTFNEDMQLRPWWTPTYDKNYLLGPFEGVSYCPRENMQNQIKQMEANTLNTIERRSLVPRMIYLSIQSAALSVKDNIEANGSLPEHQGPPELRILLERYANILGFSFHDAINMVSEFPSGHNSSEVASPNLIEWMNLAVFFNAWSLNSHEKVASHGDINKTSSWQLVNSFLEKQIVEKFRSMRPLLSYPGSDLPVIIQMVTEPLAWHILVIQSCVRSSLPTGKKKKKGGATEHSNSQLSHEIRDSILSVYRIIELVIMGLKEQLQKPVDEGLDMILSSLVTKVPNEGPGRVFHVIETCVASANDTELGDRISGALRCWHPADVGRKLISGQSTVLNEFLKICESKIKSLQTLKLQI
ncbi:N-terminal acetyltransferase B complex auxiliary subunit NAA25 isoform X2 [Apium graveolens]|uniref:N-terminal acetyltransferase B complex auxiliary subunit NAA25 isoform X2 n=1 Tax=Apium graveolens TaxID=4045 RepID=UPI003D79CE0D